MTNPLLSDSQKKHFIWPYSYDDLLNDFLEAPACLEQCLDSYFSKKNQIRFLKLKTFLEDNSFDKIVFIGNTLNYFASFVPRYALMKSSQTQYFSWECYEMTEFFDYMLPKSIESTLYIFISHSGKSRLLTKCIDHLKLLKVPREQIWMVTNANPSLVSNNCGEIFSMEVNRELVIGVKSFQNEVCVLLIIVRLLTEENPLSEAFKSQMTVLKSNLKQFQQTWEEEIEKILNFLEYRTEYLYFIARDPASLACAKLSALRSKTYHRQFAEGISLGLFFHGPFQIFERSQNKKQGAILLVGNRQLEQISDQTMLTRLVGLIRERAGKIIILSNNPDLKQWFRQYPEILIIDFHSPIDELSPIFENFIIALVFLKIAKREKLLK